MRARIRHLDGMRGLAILLVIGFHAYARWAELLPYASITKNFPLFSFGYLGVPLFFMISGFVIFMTLDKSESLISFLRKRWLRLFPAMFIASMLLYFAAGLFPEWPAIKPYVLNLIPGLTFINPETLSMATGIEFKSLAGSFWSLYVEAVFYVVIGAVYFLAGRRFCLPGLIVPMLALSAASVLKMLGHPLVTDIISKFGFIHYSWFMIGCLVYERMHNRDRLYHYPLVALAVLINFSYYVKNTGWVVIIPLLMVMAFFIASFYSRRIEKILSTPFLTAIGFSSYALYLIHENLMIGTLVKLNGWIKNEYVMLLMPLVVITVIYFMARFITRYAEPALRSLLRGKPLSAGETGVS